MVDVSDKVCAGMAPAAGSPWLVTERDALWRRRMGGLWRERGGVERGGMEVVEAEAEAEEEEEKEEEVGEEVEGVEVEDVGGGRWSEGGC